MTERSRAREELAGESARPADPKRSDRALLVLDMVEPLLRGAGAVPGATDLVRYIRGEVRYFRERARPVFFLRPKSPAGTPELVEELIPRASEPVIDRLAPSAFFGTDLEARLQAARVKRLTLVGLETCGAVLLTAADAFARGYEVVVPDPCVAARDAEDHRFALHLIRDVWRPAGAGHPEEAADEGRPAAAKGARADVS